MRGCTDVESPGTPDNSNTVFARSERAVRPDVGIDIPVLDYEGRTARERVHRTD
jgi:hypothetical protein